MNTSRVKARIMIVIALVMGLVLPGAAMADRYRDDDRSHKYLRSGHDRFIDPRSDIQRHYRHKYGSRQPYSRSHHHHRGHYPKQRYRHHTRQRHGHNHHRPRHSNRHYTTRHYSYGGHGSVHYYSGDVTVVYRW